MAHCQAFLTRGSPVDAGFRLSALEQFRILPLAGAPLPNVVPAAHFVTIALREQAAADAGAG